MRDFPIRIISPATSRARPRREVPRSREQLVRIWPKQTSVCIALYDNDNVTCGAKFKPSANYTRRSATIIRVQLRRLPHGSESDLPARNLIGRDVRLAQYLKGPEYHQVDYIKTPRQSTENLVTVSTTRGSTKVSTARS